VKALAVVMPLMVGRERERAELVAAVDDVRHGRGRAALVLGEAGMGKSTLADWLVAHAQSVGLRAARSWCSAAGMPPLWSWRRALDTLDVALSWRTEGGDPAALDRELVGAAVVEAIATAALRQPLLVVLEDLHWSDPAALLVTRAVADAVAALPVMLLLTCRDDPVDGTDQVRDQVAELPTSVRRVVLPPLDSSATARLAADTVGYELSDQAVGDLLARTGGNPYFVYEVARLMAARGAGDPLVVPTGVREVLQRRLARLSQPCAGFLAAAAIAAETSAEVVEEDLVCTVCDVDEAVAVRLLDEAAVARLLDVDPAGVARYRFRHTLVREVLEQGLLGAERGRLHSRVAASLEKRADKPGLAVRLAHHWSRAAGVGARERAAFWSLVAARDAMAGFGFEAATTYYARALSDPSAAGVGLSIEYGEALQLSGEVAAARKVLVEAAREALTTDQAVELAQAALALGGGLAGFEVPIRDEAQADLLRRADTMLPAAEVALRAAVRGRLALALSGSAPAAERVRLAEESVGMARDAGDPRIESAVLAAYCDTVAGPDFVSERVAAATRMLTLAGSSAATLQDEAAGLLARRLLVVAYLEQGDLTAADAQARVYERAAHRINVPRYSWLPEIWRGMRALLDGNPGIALKHASAAEAIGRSAHSFNAELMVFTVRLQAHLDRGTPAEFTDDIKALLAGIGSNAMPAMYLAAPARALLAAGDPGPAKTALRAFLTGSVETMPKDAEWLECHWAMADLAISLDDRPAAVRLFDALLPYEHLWAVDGIGGAVFGTVAEQLGRLAAYRGRSEEAAGYLDRARERYVAAGAPALRDRVDTLTRRRPDPTPAPGQIRRAGQVWVVGWRGGRSVVPDSKGIRDLAVLLTRPGQVVPALELIEAAGGAPAAAAGASLGPVLDDTARRAYRDRLVELERDLDEAEADADLGRLERLRVERSMLADELARALGLGGRARIAGDPAERARKAVTMRIRAAIEVIGTNDEALARHLRNTVHTGRLCSYQPEDAVRWQS
jgi:hypothetical protein